MIDFGETKIFERQVPQCFEGRRNGRFTPLHLFKKLLKLLNIHMLSRNALERHPLK